MLLEWTSARSHEARVANIHGSGVGPEFDDRSNGDSFLRANVNVLDDSARDVLVGHTGRDWLFAKLGADVVSDLTDRDLLTGLS